MATAEQRAANVAKLNAAKAAGGVVASSSVKNPIVPVASTPNATPTIPVPPVSSGVSSIGGAITRDGTISQNGTTPITPASLQPVNAVTVPTVTPSVTPSAVSGIASAVSQGNKTATQQALDLAAQQAKATNTADRDALTQTMNEILGIQTGSEQARVDAGINTKAQKVNEYTSRLEALERKQLNEIRALEGSTLTDAQKAAKIAEINRASAFEQADVALLQSAANRDLATAQSILDAQTKLKLEPLQTKLQFQTLFYNENKADLTKAEDRAFQNMITESTREYEAAQARENNLNALRLKAIESGIVLNSTDYNSALNEFAEKFVPEATKEELEKEKARLQAEASLPFLEKKVLDIDTLINDQVGISGAVGPNFAYRTDPSNFITGAKGDFIAGVEQLISQETLDTLINLKAQGGTLGALSNEERLMLQQAASKIGNWAIKGSDGKTTGYKTSEASFKKELQTLKDLAQKAINRANGFGMSNEDFLNTAPNARVDNASFFGSFNTAGSTTSSQ